MCFLQGLCSWRERLGRQKGPPDSETQRENEPRPGKEAARRAAT